jgi:hypothetical protein
MAVNGVAVALRQYEAGEVPGAAGLGFTVIVKVTGVPGQLCVPASFNGVTVIVAVIGELVLLVAVNDGMLPVPLAANPIDVFELVQLKFVVFVPVKVVIGVICPIQ